MKQVLCIYLVLNIVQGPDIAVGDNQLPFLKAPRSLTTRLPKNVSPSRKVGSHSRPLWESGHASPPCFWEVFFNILVLNQVLPLIQVSDFLLYNIDGCHFILLWKERGQRETHISGSCYCYFHFVTSLEFSPHHFIDNTGISLDVLTIISSFSLPLSLNFISL